MKPKRKHKLRKDFLSLDEFIIIVKSLVSQGLIYPTRKGYEIYIKNNKEISNLPQDPLSSYKTRGYVWPGWNFIFNSTNIKPHSCDPNILKSECKICSKQYQSEYKKNNKEEIKNNQKIYQEQNKERIAEQKHEYYETNKDYFSLKSKEYRETHKDEAAAYGKKYYQDNKERINKNNNDYKNKKIIENPVFNIQRIVSAQIYKALNAIGSSKNGESCFTYLPYSKEDLCKYVESLFEPWMNWNNQGHYNSSLWDENNNLTKTWQLDHIIPHSYFEYDALNHPNLIKAWSLKNLRPLSAKQNLLEKHRIEPDQNINNMSQKELETYIDIYLQKFNNIKKNDYEI